MTGDVEPRRRRGYTAHEIEHDHDPPDDADAFVIFGDDDGEPILWIGPEIEDVEYGTNARALFDFLVDDELDRRRRRE